MTTTTPDRDNEKRELLRRTPDWRESCRWRPGGRRAPERWYRFDWTSHRRLVAAGVMTEQEFLAAHQRARRIRYTLGAAYTRALIAAGHLDAATAWRRP